MWFALRERGRLRGVRELFPEEAQIIRCADAAAALALGEVHGLVSELHEGGVVAGIERACSDAYAEANVQVLGQDFVHHADAFDELIASLERRLPRQVRQD